VYAASQPNFAALLKLIALMISDKNLLQKYPLDDIDKKIVSSPDILKMMMDPGDSAGDIDLSGVLTAMCADNE